MGLKDLAKLAAEQSGSKVEFKKSEPVKKSESVKKRRGSFKKKGKKDHGKKDNRNITSVQAPVGSPVATPAKVKQKQPFPTPVTPEVEYQEKSTVTIQPSHEPLPLSTPVKRTEDFADKDNSVDGFLSIKH